MMDIEWQIEFSSAFDLCRVCFNGNLHIMLIKGHPEAQVINPVIIETRLNETSNVCQKHYYLYYSFLILVNDWMQKYSDTVSLPALSMALGPFSGQAGPHQGP